MTLLSSVSSRSMMKRIAGCLLGDGWTDQASLLKVKEQRERWLSFWHVTALTLHFSFDRWQEIDVDIGAVSSPVTLKKMKYWPIQIKVLVEAETCLAVTGNINNRTNSKLQVILSFSDLSQMMAWMYKKYKYFSACHNSQLLVWHKSIISLIHFFFFFLNPSDLSTISWNAKHL